MEGSCSRGWKGDRRWKGDRDRRRKGPTSRWKGARGWKGPTRGWKGTRGGRALEDDLHLMPTYRCRLAVQTIRSTFQLQRWSTEGGVTGIQ